MSIIQSVGRLGDEGPESGLLIQTDDQGDIYVTVKKENRLANLMAPDRATVRFCTLQGGGRSIKVRKALLALRDAIQDENDRDPRAAWDADAPATDVVGQLDLLPENEQERKQFDIMAARQGGPLHHIAFSLRMWSGRNPSQGSLSQVQAIMHNELLRAAIATPASSPGMAAGTGQAPFVPFGNRPDNLPVHNPGSSFGSHYLLLKMPEYQQVPAVVGYYDFKRGEWFDHTGAQVGAPVEWWPIAWPGYPKKVIGQPHPHPGFVLSRPGTEATGAWQQ